MQCNVIQRSYTQSVQKLQFGAIHFNAYNEIQYITEQYNVIKYDRSIIQYTIKGNVGLHVIHLNHD